MKEVEIIIIAALAGNNRVIGKNGKLPWPSIPEDSERFTKLTIGHAVIMGRKTWEFDLEKGYLIDRFNVVVSRDFPFPEHFQDSKDLIFVNSLSDALLAVKNFEKVYIVGGAGIYSQALGLAHKWELTIINDEYEGDTFFPEYKFLIGDIFVLTNLEELSGYSFETYNRIVH